MHPARDLNGEVQDLREEVEDLRAEVRRLRRGLAELRLLVVGDRPGDRDSRVATTDQRRSSYSGYSGSSNSPDRSQGTPPAAAAGAAQSVLVTSGSTPLPSSSTHLTWVQREEICDQIGRFLSRSISGQHRGTSGRERINLPSRLWVIVRDYSGQIYTPVKVVRNWTSAKLLVKPNNHECGDAVFVGLPSEREARRVVHAADLQWPAAVEA